MTRIKEYTETAVKHIRPEYDAYLFMAVDLGQRERATRFEYVVWMDRPTHDGKGKLFLTFDSKTQFFRSFKPAPQNSKVEAKAFDKLFDVIFRPDDRTTIGELRAIKGLVELYKESA